MNFDELSSMNFKQRLSWALQNLKPIQTEYRVVFEQNIEGPCSVMTPAPMAMAALMRGGIYPKIDTFIQDDRCKRAWIEDHPHDKFSWEKIGGSLFETAAPMKQGLSQEKSIEFLIIKNLPEKIWNTSLSNCKKYVICSKEQIPRDRFFRDSWMLKKDL